MGLQQLKEDYAKGQRCQSWNMFKEYYGVRESTLDDLLTSQLAEYKAKLLRDIDLIVGTSSENDVEEIIKLIENS
jgi:hypothetical protein